MKKLAALGTAALLGTTLAACGSSSKTSSQSASSGTTASGSATPGSPTTASGASGASSATPIKLMVIGDLQTPVQAFPQLVQGAQAAANTINASGGVNGHQITILSCNTQGDPNVSASCARSAVSDKVSAVVGMLAIQSTPVVQILQQANIPSIGSFGINAIEDSSPVSFPIQAAVGQEVGAVVSMPGWQSCVHPAVMYDSDLPSAAQSAQVVKRIYAAQSPARSLTLVPVTTTQVQYAPQIATLLSGGTDCAWTFSTTTPMLALIKQVATSGQKVKLGNNAATLTAQNLQQLGSAGDGVYISSQFELPGTTAGDAFATALKAVSSSAPDDVIAEDAYASVQIFADAAKNLTDFSGPSVLHALDADTNFNVPVLPALKSFPANSQVAGSARVPMFDVYSYQWTGSKLVQQSSNPMNVKSFLTQYGS